MLRYIGLLGFPYLLTLVYFGFAELPWWTPFPAAIGGSTLLLLLPGKADQLLSRELYGYHSDRVGVAEAVMRRPVGFGRALLFSIYLPQVVTAIIPYGFGRVISAFL